jgi:hypothetical protein
MHLLHEEVTAEHTGHHYGTEGLDANFVYKMRLCSFPASSFTFLSCLDHQPQILNGENVEKQIVHVAMDTHL